MNSEEFLNQVLDLLLLGKIDPEDLFPQFKEHFDRIKDAFQIQQTQSGILEEIKDNLAGDYKEIVENEKVKCPECLKFFSKDEEFVRHYLTHFEKEEEKAPEEPLIECDGCKILKKGVIPMINHLGENKRYCSDCREGILYAMRKQRSHNRG